MLPRHRFYQQGRGVGHDPGVPQLSQLLVVRLAVVTKLGGEDRSQLDKEDLYHYPTWVGCAAAVELQTKVIRRYAKILQSLRRPLLGYYAKWTLTPS